MRYIVKLGTENLYSPYYHDPEQSVIDPTLRMQLNGAGTFTCSVPPTHDLYDDLTPMSWVHIYDDGEWLWSGRILEFKTDFWKIKSIECEGVLATLGDTIQPIHEYTAEELTNTNSAPRILLQYLIEEHNRQVESDKQFQVGVVTVELGANAPYATTNFNSTLEAIKTNLTDKLGGYLRVRRVNNVYYLDYLKDYADDPIQEVHFGENLLDFTRNTTAQDIATRVVPLGWKLYESSVEGMDERLTIAEVNEGKVYLESATAVQSFGKVTKVVIWDEIQDAQALKEAGQAWLAVNQWESVVFDVKCSDIADFSELEDGGWVIKTNTNDTLTTTSGDRIIGARKMGAFKIGNSVRVVSVPHGLDTYFPLTEIEIRLDDPASTVITLGKEGKVVPLSAASAQITDTVEETIRNKIPPMEKILAAAQANATALITERTHGYVVLEPNRILIMDAATEETARRIWQWNVNGLGYSDDGGETYGTAITMDGAIVADFITTGQLNAGIITTGILQDASGSNYWDLDNGVLHIGSSSLPVSVTSVTTEYGLSTSSTVAPTNWSTGTPTWEQGKYIWTRTTTTYSDGRTPVRNIACIQGARGVGTQILGTKPSYSDLPATGNAGDCWLVDGYGYTWDASNNAWVNIGRIQGETGATGPAGRDGASGRDGRDGTNGRDGRDGTNGISVKEISPRYALYGSMVNEPPDSAFTHTKAPQWEDGKYIWVCQLIVYGKKCSDGTWDEDSLSTEFAGKYCDVNLQDVYEKWYSFDANIDRFNSQYESLRHDVDFSWLMLSQDINSDGQPDYITTTSGDHIACTAADASKIGEEVTQKLQTIINQTAEQITLAASETYTKKTETDNAITTLSNHYDTVIDQTAEQLRLEAVLESDLDGNTFEKTAAGIVIKPDKVTQLVSNAITQDYSSQEQTAYSLTNILNGFNSSITNIVARNAEDDKLAMRFGLAVSWSTEENPARLITTDERLVIGFHGDIFNRLKDLNGEIATAIQQLDDRITLVARNESDDIAAIQVYADRINMTVSDVDNHVSTVEQKADRIEYRLANSNHFIFGENGLELKLGENGGLKWTNDNKLIVNDLDISATTLHITIADVENLEGALESLEITDEGIRTRWNNVAEVVAINTISNVPGLRIYSDKNNQTSLTLQSEFTGTRTTFYKGYAETWGGSSHNPKLLQIDKDNGVTMYAPGYFPIIGYRDIPIAQFTSDAVSFGTQLSTTVFVVENCRIDEAGLTLKAGPYAHRYDVFSAGENGMVWREQLTWDDGTGTSTYVHTPVAKYQVASDGTATWYQDLVRDVTTHTGRTQKHYHYRKAELSDSSFTIYQKLETSVPDANLNEYIQARISANGFELYPPYQSIISDFNTNSPWGQIFGAQFTQQAADAFAQIWSDGHSVLDHALVISADKDADYGDSGGILLNASLSALGYSSTFCLEPEGARLVTSTFQIDGAVEIPDSKSITFRDDNNIISANISGDSGRINARKVTVTGGYGFIVSSTYYDNVLSYSRSDSSATTICNSDYFRADILSCNSISARTGSLSISGALSADSISTSGSLSAGSLSVSGSMSFNSLDVNAVTCPTWYLHHFSDPNAEPSLRIYYTSGAISISGAKLDAGRDPSTGQTRYNNSYFIDFHQYPDDGYNVHVAPDTKFWGNVTIAKQLAVQGTIAGFSGEVRCDNRLTVAGWTTFNGHVKFNSTTDPAISGSDARLKKNISPSTVKALEAVTAIDMKSFDWIRTGGHTNVGIIAQQLKQVAPDLVSEYGEEKEQGINIIGLLNYCVKAIQELADMVGYKPKKHAEWIDPYTLEEKLAYNELHSHK